MDNYHVRTLAQLREILPANERHQKKLADRLFDEMDDTVRAFIADSPLVFFATANAAGHVDVGPRGGEPGFVRIADAGTLLFPEVRGNHDARNLRNILENDQVALVFIIPRLLEVIRITGRASLTNEPALLEQLVTHGRAAKLCIRIEVKECFLHCGRALNVSQLWRPEKWSDPRQRPYAQRKPVRDDNGRVGYANIGTGKEATLRKAAYEAQLEGKDLREGQERNGVDVYGNRIEKKE